MDNVTHSLAGMLVAETVCSLRGEARPRQRALYWLVSILANNLPDLDVVYTWITRPKPLGSLLHHRGHTHTLPFAFLAGGLLALSAARLARRRGISLPSGDARVVLGLCLGGLLLHLLMDFGNNYGVHPFWPLSARWFYGDTIFIVEPLWWAVAIPVLARPPLRRWMRILLWALLGTLLAICWYVPFVAPASRVALLVLTAAGAALTRWASRRASLTFAWAGCLLVVLLFAWGSSRAKATLHEAAEAAFPALEVKDIAASPMPANPACWEGLLAGEQGGTYRVIRARVALAPLDASRCAAGTDVSPTARVRWLDLPTWRGVRWVSEYRAPLSRLRQLRASDCRFRALLQFARLPYAQLTEGLGSGPPRLEAGDLRYDRAPDRDFSDMNLPVPFDPAACPRFVPGWAEPRADLLQP